MKNILCLRDIYFIPDVDNPVLKDAGLHVLVIFQQSVIKSYFKLV